MPVRNQVPKIIFEFDVVISATSSSGMFLISEIFSDYDHCLFAFRSVGEPNGVR